MMERRPRSTADTHDETPGGSWATGRASRALPKRRRARARRWTGLLLGSAILCGSALLGAALGLRPPQGRILPGVAVWGIDVGARTPQEARARLEKHLLPALERKIPLVDGPRQWEVTPRELGCSYDLDAIIEKALGIGRQGNLVRRARDGWEARRRGVLLKPRVQFDRKALRARLKRLARIADIPARDATIRFDGREFAIGAERVGRVVDVDATEKNIVRYFIPHSHRELTLVVREDLPQITAAELGKIDGRISTYTTRYNPSDVNRAVNLRLAARALDGAVVPAGGVFSYNTVVGPRTEARGYRVAKIFQKGEILDGIGGGICQVSTTLYNAALEGRMRIVERAPHSRPVTYAPPGRDATVAYGGVDFRFRNTTGAPILIQTSARAGVLTVDIYGKRPVRQAGKHPGAAVRGTARAQIHGAG
jgi:vancomycin resistance protein YoaR